ncbi:hypothetical protein KC345_g12034, partial [Hortaea werneckii]
MANQINPSEAAVLAFGTLRAGTAINVIADHSELTGTFRAFSKSTVSRITQGLERHAAAIAEAYGGSSSLELREGIAVVNDSLAVQRMLGAARKVLGDTQAYLLEEPSLAGEDFGWYLDQVPGAFAFIGCGNPEQGITHALHQPRFNIDEAVLVHGASILIIGFSDWQRERLEWNYLGTMWNYILFFVLVAGVKRSDAAQYG